MPDKNTINVHGDLNVEGDFVAGDKHTTIIQKFFNIFKSDAETLEQRNRRILLNHVENAWIKGVLDASLHGAALLDLGIKQDTEAVTQYPWAIQKESTKETLPAGTSMLEVFDSMGMGRSLLILGTPGSGKTTMLLELARGLIARAREDVTQPIPMVFNLASWTEKLILADWLAQELNNLYSVPRRTAPDWVKGNKLLLLLDGLDEVRQESRAKCVEAINEFRKQNGLTSLAVCSRSQDYADLNAKLSFEGAIEVQPLTQEQIAEFFNHFGVEMAGIKQALERDSALREMAETPLFLSIMIMAYRGKQDIDILVSKDENIQRKHLFNTYVERMFERRADNILFKKQDVLNYLSWLASNMSRYSIASYLIDDMQPEWLDPKRQRRYDLIVMLVQGVVIGLSIGPILVSPILNPVIGLVIGPFLGFVEMLALWSLEEVTGQRLSSIKKNLDKISTVDDVLWDWDNVKKEYKELNLFNLHPTFIKNFKLGAALLASGIIGVSTGRVWGLNFGLFSGVVSGLLFGKISEIGLRLASALPEGIRVQVKKQTTYPGQRIVLTIKNFLFFYFIGGVVMGLIFVLTSKNIIDMVQRLGFELANVQFSNIKIGVTSGLLGAILLGISYGGRTLIQHYTLRFILTRNNLLPWRLVPFLDHCVDLIFLRRVGGGYIFVHRLLMEHFAEMYVEFPTSKGN